MRGLRTRRSPARHLTVPATVLAIVAMALLSASCRSRPEAELPGSPEQKALFASLTPVKLRNCTLRRYGVHNDGGYLMCANLMGDAKAAYSYGIDGRDDWGCDISQQLGAAVHEYDCFNKTRPVCRPDSLVFHEECVGDTETATEGRPYDTVLSQLARNNDLGKHLILKMDIEGDEWLTLLAVPDPVLDTVDQLSIEFHHKPSVPMAKTIAKLKRHFHVVHFHANNFGCTKGLEPFTSWANEVLLVNKRIGVVEPSGRPELPSPLDSPNNPRDQDCQPSFQFKR